MRYTELFEKDICDLKLGKQTKERYKKIKNFIECEKKLKEIIQKPLSVEEMIVLQAQSMIDVKNDIQRLENKFDTVVTLESVKQRKIQIEIASRVYKLLPEPQSDLENELINMYDERLTDKDIEFLKFISEQIWGSEALPLKTIKKFDEFIEKLEGK